MGRTKKKAPAGTKKTAKKKTAKTAAKTRAAPQATVIDELDPSREWSLDEVEEHLPDVPESDVALLRGAIVGAQTESQLARLGSRFRTEDILGAAPTFTIGALLALRRLGRTPPGLGLAFFPLLVQEARVLAQKKAKFEQQLLNVSSTISGRRAMLKLANSRALRARRGVAQTLLRSVVPIDSHYRAELESAAAGTDSYAGTVASVRTVARILGELRADERFVPVLGLLGYTPEYEQELLDLADELERLTTIGAALTPPQKVDQLALDLQDGLVCAIMRAIWTPLREAQSSGASLRLPPIGELERLFTHSDGDDDDDEEQGGGPPPPG